jgi:hypothetical protein
MSFSPFFDLKLSSVITIIFQSLTLWLALRIYKNLDVRKTHANRQLDAVLQLIEEVNGCLIKVNFRSKVPQHLLDKAPGEQRLKVTSTILHLSLFNIASGDNLETQYSGVYLLADARQVLPFLSQMNNPLLPETIAEKLRAFYSPISQYCNFENAGEKYVEIGSVTSDNDKTRMQYPDLLDSYKSWGNFIFAAKNLHVAIEGWLRKYGSKDINFNTQLQSPPRA